MNSHPWRAGANVGAVLGLMVAGLMMYIAWDHNAQGEIRNELGVSWGYWLGVGFDWFALVTIPASVLIGGILSLVAYARRRRTVYQAAAAAAKGCGRIDRGTIWRRTRLPWR